MAKGIIEMREEQFSARIYKIGINPYVDVPYEVSIAFSKRGYIPVAGSLNGYPIRATLVPAGKGRHRLFINGEMRKATSLGVGDWAEIAIEIDRAPRVREMRKELEDALNQNERAKIAFESLPRSRRKDIIAYMSHLKTPESIKKNVEKVMAKLLEQS